MASQVIALTLPVTGLATPTARVFAAGSDTQVSGSPFTLTEATNRKGLYTASFTGTLAGLHTVHVHTAGTFVAGPGWCLLANADGTYWVKDDPALVDIATLVQGDGTAAAAFTVAALANAPAGGGGGGGATAEEIWEYADRTLTAFGFTVVVSPQTASLLAADDYTRQNYTTYRGEDRTLTFTLAAGNDITGQSLKVTIARERQGAPLAEFSTAANTLTIVDEVTATCELTATQSAALSATPHVFDFWRLDAGEHSVLALGRVSMLQPVRIV